MIDERARRVASEAAREASEAQRVATAAFVALRRLGGAYDALEARIQRLEDGRQD